MGNSTGVPGFHIVNTLETLNEPRRLYNKERLSPMSIKKPGKRELEELAKQNNQDQKKEAPAERRVKINASFKKAVKKMGQTSPPKKEGK
jgi:hypothetical protein